MSEKAPTSTPIKSYVTGCPIPSPDPTTEHHPCHDINIEGTESPLTERLHDLYVYRKKMGPS